jgi:hypothetical protein
MSSWDTDYWPTSKCALCNVLEQVIRAGGGGSPGVRGNGSTGAREIGFARTMLDGADSLFWYKLLGDVFRLASASGLIRLF